MGAISFLAACVCTLALVEGFFVLRNNPRSLENQLFLGMSLCIALWLAGISIGYSTFSEESARFWFRVASPGFIFLHCFTLHFVLIHTGSVQKKLEPIVAISLYLPSLAFQYRAWTGILVFKRFSYAGGFWIGEPDFGALSFMLLVLQYSAYYILAIALLIRAARSAKREREKRQAKIMAWSIFITIALFNLEPFVLPLISPYRSILISPLFSIILISSIAYVVRRYNFLSISLLAMRPQILDQLSEIVILFDSKLSPVFLNTSAKWLLPQASSIEDIVTEASALRLGIERADSQGKESYSCVLSSANDPRIRLDCRFAFIRDGGGELEAVLGIAHELRDSKAFTSKFSLSPAESKVLNHIIEGMPQEKSANALGVSLRTIKAHSAHIYQKLGVENRIELFRLLNAYKLLSTQDADDRDVPMLLKRPKG